MIRRKRKRNGYNRSRFNFLAVEIDEKIKKDATGIFLFALAVISALSFVNLAGRVGDSIGHAMKLLFGFGSILFPAGLVLCGWKIIKSESMVKSKTSLVGIAAAILSILSLLHIFYKPQTMFETAKDGEGGGFLGAISAWILVSLLGKWGGLIAVLSLLLVSILLILNVSFLDLINKIRFKKSVEKADIESKESGKKEEELRDEEEINDIKVNIAGQKEKKEGFLSTVTGKIFKKKTEPKFLVKPIETDKTMAQDLRKDEDEEFANNESDQQKLDLKEEKELEKEKAKWKTPPLALLDNSDGRPSSGDIRANSNIIKKTLANFGIAVEMGEVNVGPTVTQYTLKPAVGVKLSRITSLQNDLALALAARSLRIEAPIPGKPWVGIEIPNQLAAMVRLRNLLDSNEFRHRKSNLSIALGRDVAGNPVIADLSKMPHLLIAGSTGSGKTVCINALIVSLLFQNSPQMLKFIMVDPKRVELTFYNDIPHLLTPVIVDPDKAINALKWCIAEMEERYDTLSHLGCRDIRSYNAAVRTKHKQEKILPYIVVIIDELADLMTTHGREIEAAVVRLAQMARAVGIHLVLSTQRPSVEVITGLIKANITTRIAFQVASQIDSRTILDMAGAEKLLGNGDMLFLSGDSNKPRRIQGVFVSEEEVRKVVNFIKSQKYESEECDECSEKIVEDKKMILDFSPNEDEKGDELYDQAVEVVRSTGKASASLLQRRLRIGYARAARLLDLMEENGIVGPANGAKPRDVLM